LISVFRPLPPLFLRQVWKYTNTLRLQRFCSRKPIRPHPIPAAGPTRADGALFASLHAAVVGPREAVAARGPIAVNLGNGELLCTGCGDYVYPSRVEELRRSLVLAIEVSGPATAFTLIWTTRCASLPNSASRELR
jgi:hypothetical protein